MRHYHHQRIWIVAGLSLLLHALVAGLWWADRKTTEFELTIPATQFSVSLQTLEVSPKANVKVKAEPAKPAHSKPVKPITSYNATAPIKTVKTLTNTNQQHKQASTKPTAKATITPPAARNILATQTVAVTSDPDTNRARIISRIREDLKQYFYYPRLAQRKNIQGTVTLGFGISQQGTIHNIQVVKSSGFAILDLAAEDALQQLHQVDWIQEWFSGDTLDIELPVKFKLTRR